MRDIGFKNAEVAIKYHKLIYADSGAYVNYQIEDNYEEFREMSEQNRNMFRQEFEFEWCL